LVLLEDNDFSAKILLVVQMLSGKRKRDLFPKDFKFTGWHPHCRCHAVPILKTKEEFLADLDRPQGQPATQSVNEVTDVPQEFKTWVSDNAERISTARSLPYFIKDNKDRVENILTANQEPADNLSQLAASLGITKGKPMSFEEADHGLGNPHYNWKHGDAYSLNCQSCVVANEARRRGLDVAAMPFYNKIYVGGYDFNHAFIDPATGRVAQGNYLASPKKKQRYSDEKIITYHSTPKKKLAALEKATQEEGRYFVSVYWNDKEGHIFCVEREKSGWLRSFDPQTGEHNVITRYFKEASRDYGINVLRVDNLDFDIDVVSKVITKQGTPRFAGVAEAAQAKSGVLGVPSKSGLREYKKNIIKSAVSTQSECANLATGQYFQSSCTFKSAIGHAKNKIEADMYLEISNNISKLQYVTKSPLGTGKDLTSVTDQKNLAKKRDRGVSHYNVYRYTDKNGVKWEVKTEVRRNKKETIYFIKEEKD